MSNKKEDKTTKFVKWIINKLNIKYLKKNEKLFIQIFKFTIVGFLAFFIDASIGLICKNIFHLSTLICSTLGFIISLLFNYILSIKWVYDVNKEKSSKKQFILFIIFSVIGLIITDLIMILGVDILKFNYLLIKIIATSIVMVFNFITRKLFLE